MNHSYFFTTRSRSSSGGGGGGGVFLGPLHRDDLNMKTPDGKIWKCKGHTGFRGPELAFKGEWGWLDDYFGSWSAMGANCNRDFAGMWDNTGWNCYRSRAYDVVNEYWKRYRDMFGYYFHAVYFCNQRDGGPNKLSVGEQDEHVHLLSEAARDAGNVFGEIENESTDGDNTGDASLVTRYSPADFPGVLMTRTTWGTAATDDPDPTYGVPWMDWVTFHPSRDFPEWPWESAKISMEAQKGGLGPWPPAHRPSMPGEPIRIAEGTTPRQWADCTFHCLNFGMGLIVHGGFKSLPQASHHESDLQNCKFPESGSLAHNCILAVRDVWNSPLILAHAAADGQYRRGAVRNRPVPGHTVGRPELEWAFPQNDDECPIVHWDKYIDYHEDVDAEYEDQKGAGRTYWMELPDGLMVGGPIDPGRDWALEPRLDYHVVARGGWSGDGLGGNIIHMRR